MDASGLIRQLSKLSELRHYGALTESQSVLPRFPKMIPLVLTVSTAVALFLMVSCGANQSSYTNSSQAPEISSPSVDASNSASTPSGDSFPLSQLRYTTFAGTDILAFRFDSMGMPSATADYVTPTEIKITLSLATNPNGQSYRNGQFRYANFITGVSQATDDDTQLTWIVSVQKHPNIKIYSPGPSTVAISLVDPNQ